MVPAAVSSLFADMNMRGFLSISDFPLMAQTMMAQVNLRTWSLTDVMIAIIILAACIGILYIAMNVFGVQIPQWAVQIFWIVVVAVIAILAIRFLTSM